MDIQYGGGKCSLCGSDGTNKSTCPLNPKASNKNYNKHPNAGAVASTSVSQKIPAAQRAQRVQRAQKAQVSQIVQGVQGAQKTQSAQRAQKSEKVNIPFKMPDLVFENMLQFLDNISLLNLYKASGFYDRKRILTYLKHRNKKLWNLLNDFIKYGTLKFVRKGDITREVEYAAKKNSVSVLYTEIKDNKKEQGILIYKLDTFESKRKQIAEYYRSDDFHKKVAYKIYDELVTLMENYHNSPLYYVSFYNDLVIFQLNNPYEFWLLENPIDNIFSFIDNYDYTYQILADHGEDTDTATDATIAEIAADIIVEHEFNYIPIKPLHMTILSDAYQVWRDEGNYYYRGTEADLKKAGKSTEGMITFMLLSTV